MPSAHRRTVDRRVPRGNLDEKKIKELIKKHQGKKGKKR